MTAPDLDVLKWSAITIWVGHFILDYVFHRIPATKAKSGIMAFEVIAGLSVAYLSWHGFIGEYFAADETVEDKVYGFLPRAQHMAEVMIMYQLYDLLVMFIYPSLFTMPMLIHHVLAGTLALLGSFGYMHGFCFFFFGVIECTNVPLTAIDIFKQFPQLIKAYPSQYTTLRFAFALSFIVFRLIMWPTFCFQFWQALFATYSDGSIAAGRAFGNPYIETFAAVTFFLANLALTLLQLLWGQTIIRGVLKQVGIIKPKPKTSKPAKSE